MKDFQANIQDNTSNENTSNETMMGGNKPHDPVESREESVEEPVQERQDIPKGNEVQAKADAWEEKAADTEGKAGEEAVSDAGVANEEQAKAAEEDSKVEAAAPQYSSSYAPPYYVPNFTVYRAADPEEPPKKKKKSGGKIALISFVAAAALLLAALAGCFAGALGAAFILSGDDATEPPLLSDRPITLDKNTGTVVINENEGSEKNALTYAQVAEKVASSVVEINTISSYGRGAGSGVLVSQDEEYGYLVTNYHVVGASEESVGVRLTDQTVYSAVYLAGDEAADLSVLRITKQNGETFSTATFGSSAGLKTGDKVVAIGNPLGTLGGTVTHGIISGMDVEVLVNGFAMTLLQTDAAVNPGNSGGGLFNMAGELIGIVNAKVLSEGIEGLAFAIPGDYVCKVVTEAVENGYVTGRPTLGIGVSYASSYNKSGIFVTTSNSAEIEVGDLITGINGIAISSERDYCMVIKALNIGDTVTVTGSRLKQISFLQMAWVDFEVTVTVTEYQPKT